MLGITIVIDSCLTVPTPDGRMGVEVKLSTAKDGTTWMWAADAPEEDDTWKFTEDGEGFSYIRDAPTFSEDNPPTGTLEKKATGEKFTVKLRFAKQYLNPGEAGEMGVDVNTEQKNAANFM
eukprot:Skav209424  [mRNA]  locus=scaffold805:42896:47072:- [translate_table: standard]